MKPPEYLGPYRVGDSLGRGGMGTVYQAKHAKSGEDVAVKLIAQHVSDEMRFRRRFHDEIETLKRLKHRNIVRLIGYGEEHGMLFYSMELVRGETLQSIIRREKQMEWSRTLDVAIQICSALKHAHDIGVIHRDLKPANLIVDDADQVKLVDFGISKIFGNDQTAAGSIMGTADYMAPEQATNTGITARTDLYALGCVMYAMLAGRPPFKGKSITEVIDRLKNVEAVSLDLINPDLPEDVVAIVGQLLEKSPQDRPPTALAVMNRLKAMRAGLHRMQTMGGDRGATRSGPRDSGTVAEAGRQKADGGTHESRADRRDDDTLAVGDAREGQTSVAEVDPSARTVGTEGHNAANLTIQGTAVTEPPTSDPERDTSAGGSAQTHFQTVSDGEIRPGFITSSEEKDNSALWQGVSIAVLSTMLIVGGFLVAFSLREPDAEAMLVTLDEMYEDGPSFELQNEMERFLKLFPDHERAGDIKDRHTAYRVESALRRLRLKQKLRTSETPLHEQAFLDAMALRESDPAEASKRLRQWVVVFSDSAMDDNDERVNLAELAEFEAGRLSEGEPAETNAVDPKLKELVERIQESAKLAMDERREVLEGVMTLYEDQPWADQARVLAQAILDKLDEVDKEDQSDRTDQPDQESVGSD